MKIKFLGGSFFVVFFAQSVQGASPYPIEALAQPSEQGQSTNISFYIVSNRTAQDEAQIAALVEAVSTLEKRMSDLERHVRTPPSQNSGEQQETEGKGCCERCAGSSECCSNCAQGAAACFECCGTNLFAALRCFFMSAAGLCRR